MRPEESTQTLNPPATPVKVWKMAIDRVLNEGPWRNTFKPLSYAEGACGYLCQLIDIYEKNQEASLIEYIELQHNRLLDLAAHTNTNNVSLGHGTFGLIFLQIRLFEVTHNQHFLECCRQQLSQIIQKRLLSLNNEPCLYTGMAGLLFVVLRLLKLVPDEKAYQELSDALTERLIESLRPEVAGTYIYSPRKKTQGSQGLAQGNCGIALVFIQLGRSVTLDSFYEVAKHLLLHERGQWKADAAPKDKMPEYMEFSRVCALYNSVSGTEVFSEAIDSGFATVQTQTGIKTAPTTQDSEEKQVAKHLEHNTTVLIDSVLQNDQTIPGYSPSFNLLNYHKALLDKYYPLCLEVMGKIAPDSIEKLFLTTLDNPLEAFENCIQDQLSRRKHAELEWKYHFEKQKGDWLASLDQTSLNQEDENRAVIHQLLQSKNMYEVPLVLRPDNFFLSLEEPKDIFSIDPSDRRSLSRVFMTYGARSWLMRKYQNQKALEVELFFCRILADQYHKPCTLAEGINRTVEFLLSLDERTIKLLKSISSYNGEQEFEAHLREIYHDFMYELVFEGFLSPAANS